MARLQRFPSGVATSSRPFDGRWPAGPGCILLAAWYRKPWQVDSVFTPLVAPSNGVWREQSCAMFAIFSGSKYYVNRSNPRERGMAVAGIDVGAVFAGQEALVSLRQARPLLAILTGGFDAPSRRVESLLTSGRCVSASHTAQGSILQPAACMTTGLAADAAAALPAQEGTTPRDLDLEVLQSALRPSWEGAW